MLYTKLDLVKEIRHKGMLMAIDCKKPLPKKIFFENNINLIINNKTLILAPPLIIKQRH